MDRKALVQATVVGTVVQLAMVVAGHFVPVIKDHVFAIGGMFISLLVGAVYVRMAGGGWIASLIGAAISGGVCALIGILVSAMLGDVAFVVVAFGTVASVVSGVVGGAIVRALVRPQSASPR